MERTTVYLPHELRVSIKAVAKREGASEAEVIREALTLYVRERDSPWPASFGSASSGEVPAEDLDNWLAENWNLD